MAFRIEHDSLGDVAVPEDVLWGAQTQRALASFRIGDERFPRVFYRAYGLLKQAAAEVNAALGELDAERAALIARAAGELASGALDAELPLSPWQSGSGTQTHMNVNEVLASRANELAGGRRGAKQPVHPNDHVNRGQSTNDTFPTALHVAAALGVHELLLPALDGLLAALDTKAHAYRDLVKMGRTHLQDAVPLTLGQEIGGWAAQLRIARAAVEAALSPIYALAMGGTAVGTGLNAHPDFATSVARALAQTTGLPFVTAPDKFAALAGHEPAVGLAGALDAVATALTKLANDVRWLASGPRGGLGELTLPANEPGSSIMPGKVNPTQAEALVMVCILVLGNHTALRIAASQGSFELNVTKPLIAHVLLQSIRLLADSVACFDAGCVRGLEPRRDRIAEYVDRSLMRVTALAPHIGYDAAARVAHEAHAKNITLRSAALSLGVAGERDLDAWLAPETMLGPRAHG
jgi:fumarate hydratase class II